MNPIEQNSQGLISRAVDRVDGPAKVCGVAKYSYEYAGRGKTAYGFVVGASIAKGQVQAIDTQAAERAPGVLLVLTHKNMPGLTTTPPKPEPQRFRRPKPFLVNNQVRYFGEPVAFIVAESFEAARHAARLVEVNYREDKGTFRVKPNLARTYKPEKINAGMETDTAIGDFAAGYGEAPHTLDATYTTPYQHHNAMEPHATLATWEDGILTMYVAHQIPNYAHAAIATTLNLPLDSVRVISRFVGGGFGAKLTVEADCILSAVAARELRRSVKTVLTRQQTFANCTHRPESIQRVRFGAGDDGALHAIAHDVWEQSSTVQEFAEQTAAFGRSLYAAPHRLTSHRIVALDMPAADAMRAPGEAIGMAAYECAMDELAYQLKMDPIELRVRNEPKVDPERNVPFSSRHLVECMREGAKRFGWASRPTEPASRREGRLLIGYGMSAAIRPNYLQPCKARVRMDREGRATVELDMTDIGTGTYTILAQIAAETLGLPLSQVKVDLGDTRFPDTPGSGGSYGAASSGSAVYDACMKLRSDIAQRAIADARSPLKGAAIERLEFKNGTVVAGEQREAYADLVKRHAPEGIQADGQVTPGPEYQQYSQLSTGAHFAEVQVDMDTGEVRLRRMLGVFAAGRILNTKTARSQLIGGMIWGVGTALHEESIVDDRYGSFVNCDLAGYHVPVHADVPNVEAIFVAEHDDKGNPLGIKGVGELGICGAAAAVGNAVFNATGIRVREYPITLDKLLVRAGPNGTYT